MCKWLDIVAGAVVVALWIVVAASAEAEVRTAQRAASEPQRASR